MVTLKLDPMFFSQDAQAGGFFPITHINPGFDIDSFARGQGKNTLVEGIRGTGKTHILKMIHSNCLQNYLDQKVLPVYVSLAKVSEWQDADIRLFRIQLYANIVNNTISTIKDNRDKIGFSRGDIGNAINSFKKMFGFSNDEDINEILNKIEIMSDELLQKLTYNRGSIIEKIRQEDELRIGAKGGQAIQLSFDDMQRIFEERLVKFIGQTLAYENASSFIIEFFKQLKIILGCKYVLLLLDECSESSDTAQIEIFRLLKLIRGASTPDMQTNYAYFCASVYPPYATNYPAKIKDDPFNFEPGQDASVEYLQLDELIDEYEKFFFELTRKRLEYFLNKPISNPIHEIFENHEAFILAAYLANGIPRRYLEILKQAYENLRQRSEPSLEVKKISQKDIDTSIQTLAGSQILSDSKLNQRDFKIIEEISQRISKRNKKTETENKEKQIPLPANVYFTIYRY